MATSYFPSTANSSSDTYLRAEDTYIELLSSNTLTNTESSVGVNDEAAVHIEVDNHAANTSSHISVLQNDYKAVFIAATDHNTLERGGMYCTQENGGQSFLFGQNKHIVADNTNTRSVVVADEKYNRSHLYSMTQAGPFIDGSPVGEEPNIISIAQVSANNAAGAAMLLTQDNVNGIVAEVTASYTDKNVVISAEDTSATSKIVVAPTSVEVDTTDMNIKSGGQIDIRATDGSTNSYINIDAANKNITFNTRSGTNVSYMDASSLRENVIMISRDTAENTLCQLNVSSKSKVIRIQSRNDNTGRSASVDVFSNGTNNRVNITTIGDAPEKTSSFDVREESVDVSSPSLTWNGNTVVTEADLTSILDRLTALEA